MKKKQMYCIRGSNSPLRTRTWPVACIIVKIKNDIVYYKYYDLKKLRKLTTINSEPIEEFKINFEKM